MNEIVNKMAKDFCLVKANCNDVCNPANCCQALKYAEKAYEEGYRKQVWISIDERLPEGANDYLTVSEEGIHIRFYSKEWGWNRDYGDVFYWMPLPEAPKMKGGKE